MIWYDSDYAAGIVLRRLLPQANLALAERAVMLYGLVSGRRPVELRWVKGHSYERGVGVVDPCVSWGNHVADWLADRGLTGSVGNHSRRWTAPQPWRNDREDWQVERCRKCNKSLGFSAHRAGSHEVFCTAGPLPDPGFMACRKCHRLVGSGVEDRRLRGVRDQHEGWCRGTDELNRTCRICAVVFEPAPPGSRMLHQGDEAHKRRRAHERQCERAAARAAAAASGHPGGAPAGDPGALPIAPVVAAG